MRTVRSALVAVGVLLTMLVVAENDSASDSLEATVTRYEELLDARIGVAVTDTETGRRWHYRGSERFPLTSTFKPLACAAWLANVDAGVDELERSVIVHPDQIVTYSPVTQEFAGAEMTLAQACEAAITMSDNTAGNLLLAAIGGPPGLTEFLRQIGDDDSRLDRIEPFLNEAVPGDPRDTTTPDAMVNTLMALLSGGALSAASAELLESWLVADRVADALFRSRLPAGWRIGDKSGAGRNGSRALIAVLHPPDRRAAFAAVYITQTDADFAARNEAIAAIGAAIFAELVPR